MYMHCYDLRSKQVSFISRAQNSMFNEFCQLRNGHKVCGSELGLVLYRCQLQRNPNLLRDISGF